MKAFGAGANEALRAWTETSERVWRHRPVLLAPDPARFAAIVSRTADWAVCRHFVLEGHGTVTAWRLPGGSIGHLGLFAAMPDPAVVTELLGASVSWLREEGATTILGPVDGDAWERARFSVGPEDDPPYLLEPENPPEDPRLWQLAGGRPSHRVISQVQEAPEEAARLLDVSAAPARDAGYRIAPVTPGNWRDVLGELHPMVPEIFSGGLDLAPLSAEAFLARFAPMAPLWRTGLSFVARDGRGEVVGFLLGVPDLRPWLGRAGGLAGRMTLAWRIRRPGRAVLKTLGVARAHRRTAVGHALAHAFHRRAAELGIPEVVHALMAEDNPSLHMSRGIGGRPMRTHILCRWDGA